MTMAACDTSIIELWKEHCYSVQPLAPSSLAISLVAEHHITAQDEVLFAPSRSAHHNGDSAIYCSIWPSCSR